MFKHKFTKTKILIDPLLDEIFDQLRTHMQIVCNDKGINFKIRPEKAKTNN